MTYPRSHTRGRRVLPRVSWRGRNDAQAQCDRCSHWVQHSSLTEQMEFRGGTAPVGTGIWVCGHCLDVPNPQGSLNVQVLKQDPEPVMNARPDTTTYDLTIPTFNIRDLPDSTVVFPGYQIYVTGIAADPTLCYADGPIWRNFETEAVVNPVASIAEGAAFDGASFLTRGAPLTGVVDSATGLLSFWYKPTLDGQAETILTNDIARLIVDRTGALLRVRLVGTSIGNFFRGSTGNAIVAGSSYINILATWNTNAVAGLRTMQIYVNDVSDCTIDLDVGIAFSADLATGVANYGIGTPDMATAALNGDLAEFYFAPGQTIDLSVTANRRKFITADLQPVDLGTDGSTPTGAAPAIYQSVRPGDLAPAFSTNRGTGGGMTTTGTLTIAPTDPGE